MVRNIDNYLFEKLKSQFTHCFYYTKHLPFQTDDLNHELKDFPNGNDLEKGEPADEEDEPGCIKVKI